MFSPEEAQKFAESVYQSWKAGDTNRYHHAGRRSDGNWFMVRLDEEDQKLCALRLDRENIQIGDHAEALDKDGNVIAAGTITGERLIEGEKAYLFGEGTAVYNRVCKTS